MTIVVSLAAVLIALVGLRWRWLPVVAAFAAWVGIPFAAVGQLGMAVAGLHPAAVIVLAAFTTALLLRTRDVVRDVSESLPLVLALAVFSAVALVTTRLLAAEGTGTVLNTIVVPALAFGAVRNLVRDPAAAMVLRRSITLIALGEAIVAIAVRFGVMSQPWQGQLIAAYQWYSPDFDRALGTTDNALGLVMVFTIATPLLVSVRNAAVRLTVGGLFVFATVLTESRSGLVIVTLAYVVVVLAGRSSAWTRMFVGVASVGALAVLATTSIASAVLEKFANDGGSANARTIGMEWAMENLDRFAVSGFGSGSSFRIASMLWTSLENPVLMYLVDFGLPATVLFCATVVLVVLWRPRSRRPVPGGVLAGVATVAHALTFSSIATFSSSGALLWIALGLAALPLGARVGPLSERSAGVRADVALIVAGARA